VWRKDGGRVRITAQLINAVTDFTCGRKPSDRDLKNVLALQTEIATAVTQALQATLLGAVATAVELGGTRNPHAFDAYLKGKGIEVNSKETNLAQIAAFDERSGSSLMPRRTLPRDCLLVTIAAATSPRRTPSCSEQAHALIEKRCNLRLILRRRIAL